MKRYWEGKKFIADIPLIIDIFNETGTVFK